MIAQDIVDASSVDFRSVLSNTAPDSALFLSWVDRIQKDALHTGIYNYLLNIVQPVSVVEDTPSYTIPVGGGAIRRIDLVYDRTFDRVILPVEALMYPTNLGDAGSPRQAPQIPLEMVNAEMQSQYPKYYKLTGTNTLQLFPAVQKTAFNGTYEVHYEMQVPDIVNLTDTLLIPGDGKDMMVAGVNKYVASFLHLDTDMQFWAQQYDTLKMGTANQ